MKTHWTGIAVLLVTAVVGACSSAQPQQQAARKCAVAADDPVLLASELPLFRDCDVDVAARPQRTPVNYSPSGRAAQDSGCLFAEVELIVDAEGLPEPGSIRVVRTNDPVLASEVAGAARTWRYTPAQKDGQKVRQVVRSMHAIAFTKMMIPAGTTPSSVRPSRSSARSACPSQ